MRRPKPPFLAILDNCRVRYEGRATAEQRGGRLLAVVKGDGTVMLHDLASGVKPQFYNPAGDVRVSSSRGRLVITSESRSGEVLRVSGVPELVESIGEADRTSHPPRRRVRGLERDVVRWIRSEPSMAGLAGGDLLKEVHTTGGRVDLRAGDVVLEVKRTADVRAFDQAQRYLRDSGIREVRLVCLRASASLRDLCARSERINLVILDEKEFKRRVEDGSTGR